MPPRDAEVLLGTSHFRVQIGREEIGFSDVSRLTSETDLTEPDHPRNRLETVVLRRALGRSHELYDWRKRFADGRDERRSVTISQLDGPGGRVVNAWRLVRAWPRRWSGPAFDAAGTGLGYEELELAFDDLLWLEPPRRRTPRTERTQGD